VSHPALDATVQGFVEALAAAGFVEGENVTYDMQNAQGEMANATTIAQKFVGDNVDLILSVATPTSQAAVKATTSIPIVFAAVTDPVAAGLVGDPDAPDANVTGCSDLLPVQPHLDLIKKLVPNVKTIGLLYNAGETNSVTLVEQEKAAAAAMGLETVEATAASSSEVLAAAQSLVGRVDAISVLTDNTVVSALDSVVKVCEENKIPLIAGDIDSVKGGAVAAYAFDYHDHGVQAGEMAAKVLQGTPIADIPVEYAQNLQLAINVEAAEAMGVTIPDALKTEADTTF
jgi:putative ABC transport system substrate-binding protein